MIHLWGVHVVIAPSGQESPTCGVLISRAEAWLARIGCANSPPCCRLAKPAASSLSSCWGTGTARLLLFHTDHRGTRGCPCTNTWSIRCVAGDVVDRVRVDWWHLFSKAKQQGCTSSKASRRRKERGERKNEIRKGHAELTFKLWAGWTCQDCVFQITEKYLSY